MSQPELYVGLDVSMETTAICIVDDKGTPVWRGACATDPAAIAAVMASRAPQARRIGLETGQLSNWLTLSLRGRGLPVVCLDARHAKAALKLQLNKTDANDALGLAQVVRTGWYREVAVKIWTLKRFAFFWWRGRNSSVSAKPSPITFEVCSKPSAS